MFWTDVDVQFFEHCTAHFGLGHHSPDGHLDNPLGMLLEHDLRGGDFLPTGISTVGFIDPLVGLVYASHFDLFRIDHDDRISRVGVRGVLRAMFSLEDCGDPCRQTPDHLVGRIHHAPLLGNFAFLGHVCFRFHNTPENQWGFSAFRSKERNIMPIKTQAVKHNFHLNRTFFGVFCFFSPYELDFRFRNAKDMNMFKERSVETL